MTDVDIGLLGPLRLCVQGKGTLSFSYSKVAALLAYLAVEVRPHSRDSLGALLWPESSDEAARRSLRVALTHLRRAIGEQTTNRAALLVTRDMIEFNTSANYKLDVLQFTTLIAAVEQHAHAPYTLCAACAHQLAQAIELYRGNFLADLRLPDSDAFEEWATVQRERLHRQAVDALGQLLAYHEQQGDDALAHHYACRLVELEPWDEAAHRCLMRVLFRRGQSGAALVQYKRCSRILANEFGMAPATETTVLYESIWRPLQAGR